jgi:hypothetical protein
MSSPLPLDPPTERKIIQVALAHGGGGTTSGGLPLIVVLCDDSTLWRGGFDRDLKGAFVWRRIPGVLLSAVDQSPPDQAPSEELLLPTLFADDRGF